MNTDHSFTTIAYMYRDAANYKQFHEVTIRGTLTLSAISKYLYEGEFFIPSEIGFLDLQPKPYSPDDHVWHTFVELKASKGPADTKLSAKELLAKIKQASKNEWNHMDVILRKGLL